jgi:hypothetical protein
LNENKCSVVELEKHINQENDFKTKQITIKRMRSRFENKSNQMINDEIKNKIQLEIINVNKTITNKKKRD